MPAMEGDERGQGRTADKEEGEFGTLGRSTLQAIEQ
jgi:hypothetical protein